MLTSAALHGMPMPPSSNNAYPTVRVKGFMRRVKSGEMKAYEAAVTMWVRCNLALESELRLARSLVQHLLPGYALRVECTFHFPHEKLYCKSGKLKKMDVSNRLKAAHDTLATQLGIDDSHFIEGSYERIPIETGQTAFVDVVIRPVRIPGRWDCTGSTLIQYG
jgi:Holliday junction resolvase RusA-like endonuclease